MSTDPRTRLALAAALSVLLAGSALRPMYADLGWVLPAAGAVLVVLLSGLAARAARVPALAVPLLQLPALLAYAALLLVPGVLTSLAAARTGLTLLALEAQAGVRELAPPVPTEDPLVALAVLGAGAVAVAVDLLAVGLRRAAVAGLPLLVLLAVPSGLVAGGLGWLPFTLGGAGWLLLLRVEGDQRVQRWGTALPAAGDGEGAGRVGRRIGAAALGVAAVVPVLVPGMDARLLPGSDGPGADGEATTRTYNPITRLQGQLNRPDPQTVLGYSTNDTEPDYLRLTTLDVFDGGGWRSSSLTGDVVDDGLSALARVGVPTREVRIEAELSGVLDSQWLPLPPLPSEVEVDGRWLWDELSETVFSVTSNTNRVEEYAVEVRRPVPGRGVLEASDVASPPDPRYAEPLPVAPAVQELVQQITGGAASPYDAAVRLQQWFRAPGAFVYDETTGNPGDRDPLSYFLLESRRGFCEQFASAMGAMLRVAGIPSRVAVGFTPGRQVQPGRRVVTTDDAHAWPEAWFDGVGWVRFEPTPTGDGRTDVPDHTTEQDPGSTPGGPTPTASAAPLPSVSAAPGASGDNARPDRGADALPGAGLDGTSGWEAARPALVLLGLLLLAAAPAGLAALRRARRWRSPGALAAWEQLREDAADLGHPWSSADSPRRAAARLAAAVPLSSLAGDALGRLARAAERARYSRDGSTGDATPDGLRADVALVRASLETAAPRSTRLRARLAPPSTLRWAASGAAGRVADLLDRVDDLLGALPRSLGRRLRRS